MVVVEEDDDERQVEKRIQQQVQALEQMQKDLPTTWSSRKKVETEAKSEREETEKRNESTEEVNPASTKAK